MPYYTKHTLENYFRRVLKVIIAFNALIYVVGFSVIYYFNQNYTDLRIEEAMNLQESKTEKEMIVVNGTIEDVVEKVFNEAKNSVVYIEAKTRERGSFGIRTVRTKSGTGFIIDKEGHIVTNEHVISGAFHVFITLYDGSEYTAKIIGTDALTDLAVLKIDAENLEPARLGDSDNLRPGMLAIAIGNPYRLQHTVTSGIVSALNRTLESEKGYVIHGVIQTDAAVNPGNSGGPLLNSKAEVIGVTSAIFSTSGGFEGIGFAIPINTAKSIASQIIENGKVIRPWLGITGITITPDIKKELGIDTDGVLIIDVVPNSPADSAGLRGTFREGLNIFVGDIIIEAEGKRINNMEQLIEVITSKNVGDEFEIRYIRDGREFSAKIILGERPGNT